MVDFSRGAIIVTFHFANAETMRKTFFHGKVNSKISKSRGFRPLPHLSDAHARRHVSSGIINKITENRKQSSTFDPVEDCRSTRGRQPRTGCALRIASICMWREHAIMERASTTCDLYSCLLPQCEALRACRSTFPIATILRREALSVVAVILRPITLQEKHDMDVRGSCCGAQLSNNRTRAAKL